MAKLRRPTSYISTRLPIRLSSAIQVDPRKLPSFTSVAGVRVSDRLTASSSTPSPFTEPLSLTLPVPPSINHQYTTVSGRRLLSSTGRAYKAHVGRLVWLDLSRRADRSAVLSHLQSEPLALSIRFYFTSALRRDVDGGLKIAQDALCEGLGINDNRIVETHLYKYVDRGNPRIEVSLTSATLPR